MEISIATVDQLSQLATIYARSLDGMLIKEGRKSANPSDANALENDLKINLQAPNNRILVSLINNTPVGFCHFIRNEIHKLYIDPSNQGEGIGKELLSATETAITGNGHMTALVLSPTVSAESFYANNGYSVDDTKIDAFGSEDKTLIKFLQ